MIDPFRLLHIKHIFKDYQAILGFIIFSLNKSLKMPIAKFEVQLLPHLSQHISKTKKDKSIPSFAYKTYI